MYSCIVNRNAVTQKKNCNMWSSCGMHVVAVVSVVSVVAVEREAAIVCVVAVLRVLGV